MGLKSIEVFKGGNVVIDFGDGPVLVTNAELFDAKATKDGAENVCKAKRGKGELGTKVFIHENKDGSFCVATGAEPSVWPENEEMLNEKGVK